MGKRLTRDYLELAAYNLRDLKRAGEFPDTLGVAWVDCADALVGVALHAVGDEFAVRIAQIAGTEPMEEAVYG